MAALRTRVKASATPSSNGSSLNVVFVHPDLGIGRAERLVVDAAVALQSKGHSVRFLTAHHDPSHCFPETRDGTLEICVVGEWLPRSLGGRLHALFAYLRMIVCAVWIIGWSGWQYDVVFCDQVSACIPVLKWSGKPVIFYCHFPDMLLTQRASWLKRLYRAPIDWLEEWTTGKADCILVNSKFTDFLVVVFESDKIPMLLPMSKSATKAQWELCDGYDYGEFLVPGNFISVHYKREGNTKQFFDAEVVLVTNSKEKALARFNSLKPRSGKVDVFECWKSTSINTHIRHKIWINFLIQKKQPFTPSKRAAADALFDEIGNLGTEQDCVTGGTDKNQKSVWKFDPYTGKPVDGETESKEAGRNSQHQ
ncbi:LOW QUALITY PROTEIN: uncharacterized protein LOC129586029, partial [Paramacrobiotus metropolitanus]|uniref:LOW QUALITY PROTEIN: uncharacterized protein LOC129586029 n=1 Tax=Paramacrobiotus metropolitanus TaxID=2943436 RepID=UPI002445D114